MESNNAVKNKFLFALTLKRLSPAGSVFYGSRTKLLYYAKRTAFRSIAKGQNILYTIYSFYKYLRVWDN